MRAIVFSEPGRLALRNLPDPAPGNGDVLIEVEASGICGTDVHIYRNEYLSAFPLVPGHEFGGRVVARGPGVTTIEEGWRVVVDPNLNCGMCAYCRAEKANHCTDWQGVGITRQGGFASLVTVPARACYRVPDAFTPEQLAFVEPLACVAYGMSRLRVDPGDRALVVGAGPIGLLLVQALRHAGVGQLVAVDARPSRVALAEVMGAGVALPAGPDAAALLAQQAPDGFDIVVDATGIPAVIEQGFRYLRPRGRYLMFGVAPRDARIAISPFDVFKNDWQIVGSFALCHTFQHAIAWLAEGVIDVAPLVSHRAPLADFPTLFRQFMDGETLKVHLQPNA